MYASHANDKRIIDDDGRLHVPDCTLSFAQVSPYLGREIPGWDTLGLIPDKVYRLYRSPELLQAMAESAPVSVPLMNDHFVTDADDPQKDKIAGAVTNIRFDGKRLVGDLAVWDGESIERVKNDSQRELSCGYRYVVSMMPATRDGVLVDGEMLAPGSMNHVALVRKGRAGPQATVADTGARVMKRPKIFDAISAIFRTIANPDQLKALDAELPKLGAALDEELDQAAEDEAMKKKREDEEKAAADKRATHAMGAADAEIAAAVAKATEGMVTREEAQKMANDAAQGVIATFKAREAVAQKVGVVNLDTAEAVYRFAMDKCGIEHKDLAADSLAATWAAIQKGTPSAAADSAAKGTTNVHDLFPTHIRKG